MAVYERTATLEEVQALNETDREELILKLRTAPRYADPETFQLFLTLENVRYDLEPLVDTVAAGRVMNNFPGAHEE